MMKERLLKLKEWWQSLSQREKLTLSIGTLLSGIFFTYQFLWMPLVDANAEMRKQIVLQTKNLQWIEAASLAIKEAKPKQAQSTLTTPVMLLGLMQKQIEVRGLKKYLIQLKQSNNENITLKFQKVSFDKLMRFLINMNEEHSIIISQFNVSALPELGLVDAEISLAAQ